MTTRSALLLHLGDRSGALAPGLSLEHMGFSTYRASFRAVEGSLGFDPAGPRRRRSARRSR